jgi:hypothetical protein
MIYYERTENRTVPAVYDTNMHGMKWHTKEHFAAPIWWLSGKFLHAWQAGIAVWAALPLLPCKEMIRTYAVVMIFNLLFWSHYRLLWRHKGFLFPEFVVQLKTASVGDNFGVPRSNDDTKGGGSMFWTNRNRVQLGQIDHASRWEVGGHHRTHQKHESKTCRRLLKS